MSEAKFIVGIDLGTTNTVVTYAPVNLKDGENHNIKFFPIVQEFSQSAIEEKEVLPSFLFERETEDCPLPWKNPYEFVVGEYARERGADVPGKLVSSAKSWLCNPRIDRREAILPWTAPEGAKKISPQTAATEILRHIRLAWNTKNSKAKLEEQIVVVTIPASFDAAARDLTMEAAKDAGLNDIILLEEPQAAFYSWIHQSEAPWREQVKKDEVVLVVDVGGGTTDFSLIEIGEENGDLVLDRVAVGNHILLGGDNMDLTLAYQARQKLEASKKKISTWQTLALSHACRKAKERILGDPEIESEPIVIAGRGSSVIGGSLKTKLERSEIESILIDGFFPVCSLEDLPADSSEAGFREVNLAYAADPGITRHLARFLNSRRGNKDYTYPNAILFNGGVFRSAPFRDKLVEVINSWLKEANKGELKVLKGDDLGGAVALGATYFGLAKQGKGIRIRGGVSQAYYLGIETSMPAVPGIEPPLKALCVAQIGMEEGAVADVPNHTFGLVLGRKANFKFFKSNSRTEDQVGRLHEELPMDVDETSHLSLTLPAKEGTEPGTVVDVNLQVAITEIGTLEIWCKEKVGTDKWKLEFNVRDAIK